MTKLNLNEIEEYTPKQFKIANKFSDVRTELNEFFYPFITPKELVVLGKVLRKIKKHNTVVEEG